MSRVRRQTALAALLLSGVFLVPADAADRGLKLGHSYTVVDKGCSAFPKPGEKCPSIYVYPAKLVVIHNEHSKNKVVYEFVVIGQDLVSRYRFFVRESDIPWGRYRHANMKQGG